MTNFSNVLAACESAGGAGSKKVIQQELSKLDSIGQSLMHLAMNPYIVFGIKQFEMPLLYSETTDFECFVDALQNCSDRKVTGDAARHLIEHALSQCTAYDAIYFSRIIDKDPRGGFSIETYNKVHPQNPIPDFTVMLADKCSTEEEFDQYVKFPCIADVKYDGLRTVVFVKENEVTYRARSGKIHYHLAGLFDVELLTIHKTLGYNFVIDGESFAGTFTETLNAKKAGNDSAKANTKLHVFNLMPMSDWFSKSSDITMEENRRMVIKVFTSSQITPSTSVIVNSYNEMVERCNHVIDVEKQEGLILKDMDAFYVWDRSMTWCKVKRFYPADARIVGFYFGKPKTKLENTIGGAIVAGYTEDGVYFETCVGSGFLEFANDERPEMPTRSEILSDLGKYINATAVLKYQEVTKAKGKSHASLRFPTIESFRWDKTVELPDDAILHFPTRVMITQ